MHIAQLPRRFVESHWGGTETVILETCKRLVQKGHNTKIFCPNALSVKNVDFIDGIPVERFPYFYPYFGLNRDMKSLLDLKGGNLFSFALMRALLKEASLDLIHLHTSKRTGGIGRYAAIKRRIPYVVSLHGGAFDVPAEEASTWTEPTQGAYEWGKLLGWWVGSRRVFDDAAAILCVGLEESELMRSKYPHKKVVYLPNGVDPAKFAYGNGRDFRVKNHIEQDAFVLTTVGRIDPQKNQLFCLKCLHELIKIEPNLHYLIVGPVTNETYFEAIQDYVRVHSIEKYVTIIPGLPAGGTDLVDAFHASDLFVLPSIHEPFGIVILEAWASGIPVLAARVGGIPAFVDNCVDGLLFTANNMDEFVHAFKEVVFNVDAGKKLGEAGRLKANSEYSWDSITSRLVSTYEEAVRENPLRK